MKNIFTKKVLASISIISLAVTVGAVAYADSALRQITAYQNQALKVTVNGSAVDMSSEDGTMYPIVYEGHSYVSAKAVAEKLGATVRWNNDTQTVEITSSGSVPSNAGIPDKDNSGSAPATPTPAPQSRPSASGNTGSLTDPIAFGSSFTYTDNYNYKEGEHDTTSVQYTVTVKKATPITRDEIEALGFKKPEASSTVDYVMVDLNVKAANASMKKGSDSGERGYEYLRSYVPKIWGSKTLDGDAKIIGGTEYGFDGAFQRVLEDKVEFTKITQGNPGSYEVSGKVLLPIIKGQSNLFVLQKQDTDIEYDSSMIHFKLN
ncbi:stalk domain-containing protein [Paenibacillus sp. SI8]|uniref:stalk domain-containing protein n=1 Tax=unclassified Paenibacillus TaxID=185978 RepID=UPI003467A9BC